MRKVFISFSNTDGDMAALVAGAIEGMGCDCWMTPRDIAPGCDSAEAIVGALDGCVVFLLLLTSDSQASEHVARELERAVSQGKQIMAVCLEKVSPGKSFGDLPQVAHWIDASDSLDAASLAMVADAAVALAEGACAPEPLASNPAQASPREAREDVGPLTGRDRASTFDGGQRFGDFEILGQLGQGGMGTVYKAQQISLERPVALKTLQGALASDREYIARFRREAKAAAALNHPNLVQVYAAGENDGLHWFAMEYVEGESAQDRLKRKGRLEPSAAIAIAMNVATALEHAWRKAQLIHRDIKPDNIFLSSDGEVKLGDLGLAKSVDENQSLTMTGASMGTPHYVSPEQAEGKKDVDLRADIYSLGCTLFHLLSGKPPFEGGTAMAVMMKHITAPAPELGSVWPECPEELSRVVMKMMAKQPDDRQQSHEEVIADLRRAYDALSAAGSPGTVSGPHASKPGMSGRGAGRTAVEKTSSSRKRLTIAAIALLAAIGVLLHFAPWKRARKKGVVTDNPVPPAPATPTPTPPALPRPAAFYAGTWKAEEGKRIGFILKEDFTGVLERRNPGAGDVKGTWKVDKDGEFTFHHLDGGHWLGKFSSDGQTLEHPKSGAILKRDSPPLVTPIPSEIDPAKPEAYVGVWKGRVGKRSISINEDRTALRTDGDGTKTNGNWEIVDGSFRCKWIDRGTFNGKLSEDGQILDAAGESGGLWSRQKP